jgi:hypothetical protein
MNKGDILVMYKRLVRKAQYFPSKNQKGMVQAIKDTFKQYRDCKDEKVLARQYDQGKNGMVRLDQYIKSFVDTEKIKPHHRSIVKPESEGVSDKMWEFEM